MRKHRYVALLTIPALLGLAACTGDDGLSGAVDDLVAGLEDHALDVSGGDFAAAVEPLAAYALEVTAGEPERDGRSAIVPLSFAWDIAGDAWTYDATATLDEGDDGWTVRWDPSLVADGYADGDAIAVSLEYPERAEITGPDGEAIVTERPVTRYGLDKSWIEPDEVDDSARRVAEAVGVDADAFVAQAEAMGDQAFVEAIVLRPEDAAERVPADYADIPGASAIDTTMQLAPTSQFARPLLGTVGEATAEIIEQSDGEVLAGEQTGLSGLQMAYDARLRGTPAVTITSGPEGSEDPAELASFPAEDGEPLAITLDEDLETKAEQVLAGVDGASALVAIRPSTGGILAAANGQGNDGFDAATSGQYAPGSTFKVVTTLALLRSGMAPDDAVSCAESVTVDGFEFHNYPDYPAGATGDIPLREAVANSCNTAFVGSRGAIDDDALEGAAAALGLTGDPSLGYPAYLGQVPESESETEFAADLIGQGRILASPLAMATVAASVAAGHAVTPVLVDGVEPDGVVEPDEPLTDDEAATLHELMRGVVTDGSASFLAGLSPEVAAKTGTAEYGEADESGELATHAWMIAIQGDLAVAAFVETGSGGASTAGPLVQAFLS
ncbi:penicillin-binding transpeptidase domain-containing protein [Microbacterium indicum]|uniref:penicillin-binding transpeptidase domain-containing protein n=1 Tax=Microbacterium indicum TaxID=358100 RepID=UPI00040BC2B7|nr:penicillin-binding transpeptidase domain-containing protein [Microbacterium indicum]